MKFKGSIFTTFITDSTTPTPILEFTQNQIIFPENINGRFENSVIQDGVYYALSPPIKNIDMREKYKIVIKGKEFRLFVNKANERKLKWVHGLTLIQQNKIAFAALIVAIITAIVKIISVLI